MDRPFQLESTSADVWMRRLFEPDVGIFRNRQSGFPGRLIINQNIAGHDECLSLFACLGEAAFDQQPVDAFLHKVNAVSLSAILEIITEINKQSTAHAQR